jgi:hypothetical protein
MATNDPRPSDNAPNKKKPGGPKPNSPDTEGFVDLSELPPGGDSAIPLAQLPESPSGQSLATWTEVIRRQRAAREAAEVDQPYQVDAASDKDLLNRLVEAEQRGEAPSGVGGGRRPGDTSEIPESKLPLFPPQPKSESEIDLGPSPPTGPATGGSEVRFDILYPPSDAGGAMPLPSNVQPASDVDFFPAKALPAKPSVDDEDAVPFAAAIDPGLSGVDLGGSGSLGPGEPGRSSILDVLLREPDPTPSAMGREQVSDILDFGETPQARSAFPTHPAGGAEPHRSKAPTHPGVETGIGSLTDDGPLDLDGPASGHQSEESIDLYAEPGSPPSLTDSGTLEISDKAIEESVKRAEQLESSAVDLNPQPSYSGSHFDVALGAKRQGSDADIDLELPSIDDTAGSSIIHPRVVAEDQIVLAAEMEARRRKVTEKAPKRAKPQQLVPVQRSRFGDDEPSRRRYLIPGGIGVGIGICLMLVAYAVGALPDRKSDTDKVAPNHLAAMAKLQEEADTAKREANNLKGIKEAADKSTTDVRNALNAAGINNRDPVQGINNLAAAKRTSDDKVRQLTAAAAKGTPELATLRKAADDAKKAEQTAKKDLADVQGALTDARKETAEAKKAAEQQLLTAETKEKQLTAKLTESERRETELAKAADAAKKSAADASKARDASDALVKSIGDRLAKAKFVSDTSDAAAVVRGLDDVIKAATSDATTTLREELVESRKQEAKLKTDLAAAREKEAESSKSAATAKAEAQRLTTDAAKLKTENDKLSREATEAVAKAATAEKSAAQEKAEVERLAADLSKAKAENDRLARDIETVRELTEMLRTPGSNTSAPLPRQEPAKLAERFFGDGLRGFYAGQYQDAESNFRKAIQFNGNDARYHYLLGLALWMARDAKGAELAFEKGRDLELAGLPTSRAVSAVLERIQGQARQAVNAYRP